VDEGEVRRGAKQQWTVGIVQTTDGKWCVAVWHNEKILQQSPPMPSKAVAREMAQKVAQKFERAGKMGRYQ